ncbi:ISAs1 family transposase [Microcoleus sp. Pol11C3]|uniref:ISAs1 family transposase n=1 Tax=Microcoleus sp. Pol11C3 TaxID=3055390 RepID=UPI00404075D4
MKVPIFRESRAPHIFKKCYIVSNSSVFRIDTHSIRRIPQIFVARPAIHMVSAWATSQRLVLGQVKVDKKSNEITAIPALLKVLKLNGSIVTIDAMGCQKSIVKSIVEQGGDYVITLKNNQPSLYTRVKELFEQAMKKFFLALHIQLIRPRKRVIMAA